MGLIVRIYEKVSHLIIDLLEKTWEGDASKRISAWEVLELILQIKEAYGVLKSEAKFTLL